MRATFKKNIIIVIVSLVTLYLFIDMVFIRGWLVESYSGEVVKSWDNSEYRFRGGPHVSQATVRLNDGRHINVVCEGFCSLGTKVTVEKYQPLIGWQENYYAKNGT